MAQPLGFSLSIAPLIAQIDTDKLQNGSAVLLLFFFVVLTMESSKPSIGTPNPLLSFSTYIHQHCIRLGAELTSRIDDTKRFAGKLASNWPPVTQRRSGSIIHSCSPPLPFASVSQGKQASDAASSSDRVSKTLTGTAVYTVSNSNNEFVLISDPNGLKSIGLLCFRQEDAEAFLAQVRSRKGMLRGGARVVPITLDQVYMLKVEGIAFRFLPDPVQVKNALELKASDVKRGFDGVPVFQAWSVVVVVIAWSVVAVWWSIVGVVCGGSSLLEAWSVVVGGGSCSVRGYLWWFVFGSWWCGVA
ncbi:unnamed protein product [Ilex paraguariensis]|uniref:Protein TIC 22, chloroplastic n=1 Tax=Ilex paraguariensis TaxID=185542 RepID=A0ABC8U5I8_9AQUA